MRPAHYSFLSIILKRNGSARTVWYCGSSVATPMLMVRLSVRET